MTAFPLALTTPRLTLRQFRTDDGAALHAYYGDPECVRFTMRRVLTEGESWRAMASMAGHWMLRGYGPYAVEETTSGQVLGVVGPWYPHDWPEPEVKWALARAYWGRGFASEAVRAVLPVLHEHLGGKAPISLIDADNSASIRLALAVGAQFERELDFRGVPCVIYRHQA